MKNVVLLNTKAKPDLTFGDLILRHLRDIKLSREIGESQEYTLERMAASSIGKIPVSELVAEHFVQFGRERASVDKVCPATLHQDVTYLHGVVRMMKLWKTPRAEEIEDEFEEAELWLDKLHLVGKSRPRDRRPTQVEIDNLVAYFDEQEANNAKCEFPMSTIIRFAIASCRRQGEITRLLWEDFEEDKRMLTVRDMKDPRHKKGNNHRFPLLGEAFDIVKAQPMVDERIFPYNSKSICQRFVAGKKKLKIENLHFHDLRREGITRLLEAGYTPQQVKLVSGHKTIVILDRVYNASDPESVHKGPAARGT